MPPRGLHGLALVTAVSTLGLIVAGAFVTSTGSGLAVPDWPLSFGQFMPEMAGGVFYEHGHRMVATFVGFLTTVLTLWLLAREPRRWVRRLGLVAMAAILLQGLLGGLTVLLKLPPAVSIGHAGMAQIFFCLVVSLALFTSPWGRRENRVVCRTPAARFLRSGTVVLCGLVYLQILLGALVRHQGAGLSIRDFPLSMGRIIPPLDSYYVTIHFAHRVGALLVLLMAAAVVSTVLASRARSLPLVGSTATVLGGVVALQILLGGLVIWTEKALSSTVIHVATGALVMACSLLLALAVRATVRPPEVGPSGEAEPLRRLSEAPA